MKLTLSHLSLALALASVPACIIVVSDDGVESWHDGHSTNAPSRTEVRNLDAFHAVELRDSANVAVRVGEAQSLVVTAPEDLLPFLKTEVKEGRLVVERAAGAPHVRRHAELTITVPALDALEIAGSGDATIANLAGGSFRASIAGSGDLKASGTVDKLEVEIAGSGDASLGALAANEVCVKVNGSGDVRVAPVNALDVRIQGSGDVHYRGSPRVTQEVRGSGDVVRD